MEIDGDSEGSEVGHCEVEGFIDGCSRGHEGQGVRAISCEVRAVLAGAKNALPLNEQR